MKKMRKIFAVLLTLAMVLGMSMTTFAAKTGATLTVKGLATNGDQEVNIYEIYRLDADDNNWVPADWTEGTGVTTENITDKVILEALKVKALASFPEKTQTTATGSVRFDGLQAGAYLVLVTDTTGKTTYNTMVAKTYKYDESNNLLCPIDETVVAKAEGYTTDKTADATNVEVGDLITYTVKTTVPYQDGNVKAFSVTDTLTGATYYLKGDAVKGKRAVNTITVNGTAVVGLDKLDETLDGTTTFTLDLESLVTADNTYAGQEVVITYTAKVDKVNEITNTANSTHDSKGTITKTYTGNATITKYDETTNVLAGAQFVVYRNVNKEGNTVKEYAVLDENGWITGEWKAEGENGALPEGIGSITTSEAGTATVKGLSVGEYNFKEIVAPDGYSINTTDVAFEMIETRNEKNVVTGVVAKEPAKINMHDTKLNALPSTGGIGTTIFTIAGCAIMVAAAGLFFASRKRTSK